MTEQRPKRVSDRPPRPIPTSFDDPHSESWIPSQKPIKEGRGNTLSTLGYSIIITSAISLLGVLIFITLRILSYYGVGLTG